MEKPSLESLPKETRGSTSNVTNELGNIRAHYESLNESKNYQKNSTEDHECGGWPSVFSECVDFVMNACVT